MIEEFSTELERVIENSILKDDNISIDRIRDELSLMSNHDYSKWWGFFDCLEVIKALFDEENVAPFSKGTIGSSYIAYLKGYSIVNSLEYDIFPEFIYGNSKYENNSFCVEYIVPKGFKRKAIERFKEKKHSISIPPAPGNVFLNEDPHRIIIDKQFIISFVEGDIWVPKWYGDFANDPERYLSSDGLSFAERVRNMSFKLSSYVDEQKALFSDRDEVMRELVDHGYYSYDFKIDRHTAFEVTEYVRKGFAHSAATSEGYLELISGYLNCEPDALRNIKHLVSRAKSVACVIAEIYQEEKQGK